MKDQWRGQKRQYKKLSQTGGLTIAHVLYMELPANFAFVGNTPDQVAKLVEPYDIDALELCLLFDGATFEYYTKRLKVAIYIYDQPYYSFEFTKPQWLGAPPSKHVSALVPGIK